MQFPLQCSNFLMTKKTASCFSLCLKKSLELSVVRQVLSMFLKGLLINIIGAEYIFDITLEKQNDWMMASPNPRPATASRHLILYAGEAADWSPLNKVFMRCWTCYSAYTDPLLLGIQPASLQLLLRACFNLLWIFWCIMLNNNNCVMCVIFCDLYIDEEAIHRSIGILQIPQILNYLPTAENYGAMRAYTPLQWCCNHYSTLRSWEIPVRFFVNWVLGLEGYFISTVQRVSYFCWVDGLTCTVPQQCRWLLESCRQHQDM